MFWILYICNDRFPVGGLFLGHTDQARDFLHFFFSFVLRLTVSCARRESCFVLQMDPENKPTRDELKEEVLKVSKGLVGLGGFNLVSCACSKRCSSSKWMDQRAVNDVH